MNSDAVNTYNANFSEASVHELDVFDYCQLIDDDGSQICDVLQLSCPCQFFSPNNTKGRNTERDLRNHDAIFCVEPMLKKNRPRFVHGEQTFGFLYPRFKPSFNAIIKGFTDCGYSIE